MKYTTGARLKVIADTLYEGNVSELARNLEMKPQALRKYVTGKSMPGGLILIRLYDLGININWFLTGEGPVLTSTVPGIVSDSLEEYLARLNKNELEVGEQEKLDDVLEFSKAIKELNISDALRRALLLVYIQHLDQE